ncbi:nitroreductase [Elusimicrobium posterum]|uniref:SagB/ThcOx family dehydrogenase n=1 Tax=Elusimicrobium posterum TaxID=3116653 RepID=UPI003C75F0C2
MKKILFAFCVLALTLPAAAQQLETIKLKEPQLKKGTAVMKALSLRKSTRIFSDKELDAQTVSNLLWAANGVNRPDGKRTAPSAMNRQDIDVYLCNKDGAYLYNHKDHALEPVSTGNCRLRNAPVTLVLVANAKESEKYAYMDAGIVSQNISIFAAGMGLATVPQGSMPQDEFKKILKLKDGQILMLNHPVGYAAETKVQK